MAKLTDYARRGFRRRQRPWDRAELPEWWDFAVWVAAATIIVMLVVSAVSARGESGVASNAGEDAPRYVVQKLDPRTLTHSPSPGVSPGSPPPAGSAPSNDFGASDPARVPMTGGGETVVPAGARNVALAAAKAMATGDWTGVPIIGAARPKPSLRTPDGAVTGGLTVADPARTGNSQYRFSTRIATGGTAAPKDVTILVEPDQTGYAIRID